MTGSGDRLGEFGRIARYFAPLAGDYPGAYGLVDDAAVIGVDAAEDLVVTVDALVESVHFLPSDSPDLVARKLLRVNLSDLAAKGARPEGYFLSLALPSRCDDSWVEAFARGLASDQTEFGIHLAGGDSVSTAGPVSLSITAFGRIAAGQAIRRGGARAGDGLYVSGTIGDGALGLLVATGRLMPGTMSARRFLEDRYRLPRPRLKLGQGLVGLASAALDISDGLAADVGHLADVSGVAAVIDSFAVPLSDEAAALLADDVPLFATVLTGGDDYELVFSAPPDAEPALQALAAECGVPIARIGRIRAGRGVTVLDRDGAAMALAQTGYRHV